MSSWLSSLTQAHALNWAYDDRYRWGWYVGPQAAAIVLAAWLIGGAPTSFPGDASWGRPEGQFGTQMDQLRDLARTDMTARERLKRLAESGEPFAQFSYATLFDPIFKLSETQDINKALEWYKKSADQGSSAAQAAYGARYYNGDAGVAADYAKAFPYLMAAAKQGVIEAQRQVALALKFGHGTPVDAKAAVQWFRTAADKGDAYSQAELGDAYAEGNGVDKNINEAFAWYRKAADAKEAYAQRKLALMYYNGTDIPKDLAAAFQLFKSSAEQNDSVAQGYLGYMYSEGIFVQRDPATGVGWTRKSADQGFGQAQNDLGVAYWRGAGVEKDLEAARAWFEKAKANGSEYAVTNLKELDAATTASKSAAEKSSLDAWRSCINAERPATAISLCFPLTNDRTLDKSNMASVYAKLAWACQQVDNFSLSVQWAHKALELQQIPSMHYIAGLGYLGMKDGKKAIEEFDAAIAISSKYALAAKARGDAYLLLGDTDRAKADFERALQMDPKLQDARNALKQLNKK